jgi:diguanylate cyclase (GGDEF)-like protein
MSALPAGSDRVPGFRRLARGLASRLEWRLLAVFLAASLLPLAVSDWIATSVIGGIGQRLTHERDSVAMRAVARQVFERLVVSRAWLRAVDESGAQARVALLRDAVGPAAPFLALACARDDVGQYAALLDKWERSRTGGATPAVARSAVALRLGEGRAGHAALLMALTREQPPPCIAVLNPDFAWEAVHDSADDSAWVVRADDGSSVVSWQGEDARQRRADSPDRFDRFTTHLFLETEFGAGNWTVEQVSPRPSVAWHGIPVVDWLLLVAAATLLLIGLAAHRTIRRTLRPLEALAEGSRRLAAGIAPARVDIRRNDELGRLASSFNDMATQLEDRIASLRALARIDAGILAGADFHQLASAVLDRLAALQPRASTVVVWQDEAEGLLALGHAGGQQRREGASVERLAPPAHSAESFERLEDGVLALSALNALGIEPACLAGRDAETRCIVLGIRDGAPNRAMIVIDAGGAAVDLEPIHDLRDRLTVAVVARSRQQQLEYRATRDLLTGLRNRYGLQVAIEPLLAVDHDVAVLFVDLDHFKDVNDCYGHLTGDRLLQAAARRLQRAAPPEALLSRNGGDEFVVVLPGTDAAAALAAAGALLDALRQPFIIATTEHRCSASVGIAMYPEHGLDSDDFVRCADIALYQSKNDGRNRATLFRPALDTQLRERNELLAGLDRGLRRSEFVVHYQPRLDARSGKVAAAEALVRWQHPERGLTLPAAFIDLAESSGMIDALGLFVMETAITQLDDWRRAGVSVDRISVNVSQHQFSSGDLVTRITDMLSRRGVPGTLLEIEVTESVLGGDIDSVRQQLHELRALGISVAMDDFGTGYSSLSQLRTLPIDVMKIDRAFVKDLDSSPDAVAIARTIVTLARALELAVVAEGIETATQAELLKSLGCDQFQGFLYSKALPPREFERFARG